MSDTFYRAFEERYRGSRELIKDRLRAYTPFIAPLATLYPGAPSLDLGCGRGEWLELSMEQGFAASGVDLDEGMLAACRERGLSVQTADAMATLRELPDASLALVSAFHLVEHLPFADVQQLIHESLRVLLPGGLLIMETPNPENLIVGTNHFYLDPSHVKPVPHLLLGFMVDFAGFTRHTVMRLQGSKPDNGTARLGLLAVLQDVSADYGVVAQKQADADIFARFAVPFESTYGTPLVEMAAQFDYQTSELIENTRSGIEAVQQRQAEIDTSLGAVHDNLAALNLQGGEQARGFSWLDESLRALAAQTEAHIATSDANNTVLWNTALPGLDKSMAALSQAFQRSSSMLEQRIDAIENAAREAAAQAIQAEQLSQMRLAEAEARMHSHDAAAEVNREMLQKCLDAFECMDRNTRAELDMANERALAASREALLETTRQQLHQVQSHVDQLHQQLAAMHASTSWRVTGPVRLVGRQIHRIRAAIRDQRVISGLMRRLSVLRTPVNGLRERVKHNRLARQIGFGVVRRFPVLNGPLRRLIGAGSLPTPVARAALADWPDPLPEEYLHMPRSSRKVLLDLAREGQHPTNS